MRHRQRRIVAVLGMLVVPALVVAGLPTASAQPAPAAPEARDPPPPLPADILKDAKVIAPGRGAVEGAVHALPRRQGLSGESAEARAAPLQAGFRLGPGPQRLPQHAAVEGGLHAGAGDRDRRLRAERRVLAVGAVRNAAAADGFARVPAHLFVLGTALSSGKDLYLMPKDALAGADPQPGGLNAAGPRPGFPRSPQADEPDRG